MAEDCERSCRKSINKAREGLGIIKGKSKKPKKAEEDKKTSKSGADVDMEEDEIDDDITEMKPPVSKVNSKCSLESVIAL